MLFCSRRVKVPLTARCRREAPKLSACRQSRLRACGDSPSSVPADSPRSLTVLAGRSRLLYPCDYVMGMPTPVTALNADFKTYGELTCQACRRKASQMWWAAVASTILCCGCCS